MEKQKSTSFEQLTLNAELESISPLPPAPALDHAVSKETDLQTLHKENQLLKQQLEELQNHSKSKEQNIEQLQQFKEAASNQLSERIRKTVAVLVRYCTSAELVPEQIPDLFRDAIHTIRSQSIALLHENTELRNQYENLESKYNLTLPQTQQLPLLQEKVKGFVDELETLKAMGLEKDQLIRTLKQQNEVFQSRFTALQKEHDRLQTHLQQTARKKDDIERGWKHLQTEHQRVLEQLQHLTAALEVAEENRATETNYKVEALERKLLSSEEVRLKLLQDHQKVMEENKNWERRGEESQTTIDELKAQIHSLNHHIQHRLSEIAKTHDIDRQWIANHVIQFYLHPEKQKDILLLLSNTLGFTQEQKIAVGLVAETPIPSHSLGDQWISFLLKEAYEEKE